MDEPIAGLCLEEGKLKGIAQCCKSHHGRTYPKNMQGIKRPENVPWETRRKYKSRARGTSREGKMGGIEKG